MISIISLIIIIKSNICYISYNAFFIIQFFRPNILYCFLLVCEVFKLSKEDMHSYCLMRTTVHILAFNVFMVCLMVVQCSWLLLDYTIKPHWNSVGFLIFSTSLLPSYHNNRTSYGFGEFIIFRDNNLWSKLACLHPCSDTDFYNWKQKIHWSPCRVVVVAALEVNILQFWRKKHAVKIRKGWVEKSLDE